MNTQSVNQFRSNLKALVEKAINSHEPLKVTRRAKEAFVVLGADEWERTQETLYVLQNQDLMRQIAASTATHDQQQGYIPTPRQLDEITSL